MSRKGNLPRRLLGGPHFRVVWGTRASTTVDSMRKSLSSIVSPDILASLIVVKSFRQNKNATQNSPRSSKWWFTVSSTSAANLASLDSAWALLPGALTSWKLQQSLSTSAPVSTGTVTPSKLPQIGAPDTPYHLPVSSPRDITCPNIHDPEPDTSLAPNMAPPLSPTHVTPGNDVSPSTINRLTTSGPNEA